VVPLDLEQIFLNLLNNSIDSIQTKLQLSGKRKAQLKLKTKMSWVNGKAWAIVEVYDTGVGIRKMDLRHVLKPFFTTKRLGEGTGLGLTICQQLAQKYDGDLLIDSKEGAWTEVVLRLPYPVNS
jgi:two-component system NtrC family sensor kinase